MSTGAIIGIVVAAAVVLVLVALLARSRARSRHLRERFGPEYDRAVAQGSRREAERELAGREKRYSELDIRALDPAARERFTHEWTAVQEQFVDRPGAAVAEADRLVTALMAERGYPTDGSFDQRLADLSVQHASTLEHYRAAHDVRALHDANQASTEDLREAMLRYRALFEDLLGPANTTDTTDTTDTDRPTTRGVDTRGVDNTNGHHATGRR